MILMSKRLHYKRSKIYQYSLKGEFINSYSSCVEAGKANYLYPRVIEKATRGELLTAGNYIWVRVEPHTSKKNIKIFKNNEKRSYSPIKVNQYDLNNNFIKSFNSINEASKHNHIDNKCIRDCLKGRQKSAGGFIWKKDNKIVQ